MKTSALAVATIALILPAFATSARATDTFVTQQVKVRFADLDLSRQDGVDKLYVRIRVAARKVCALPGEINTALPVEDRLQCVRNAVERAVQQSNRPALMARHRSQVRTVAG